MTQNPPPPTPLFTLSPPSIDKLFCQPAMTWALFCVGYIELGPTYAAQAASNFNRSFANAQPPFYVWTETPTGGAPNFLTGAGGWLQGAFSGYPGLRSNSSGLFFINPALPEGSAQQGMRGLSYLGNRLDMGQNATHIRLLLESPASEEELQALGEGARRSYASPCAALLGNSGGGGGGCNPGPGAQWRRIAAGAAAAHLSLEPTTPLAARSQQGRVTLGGSGSFEVRAAPLVVVDASGAQHALQTGEELVLASQSLHIMAAPGWQRRV